MLLKTLHEFCHAVVGTLLAAFKQWVHVGMVQGQARRRSFKKAKQRVPPAKLCACERDNALHSAQPSTPTVLTSSTLRKRDQHIALDRTCSLRATLVRLRMLSRCWKSSICLGSLLRLSRLSRATYVVTQGEARQRNRDRGFRLH